MCRGPGHYHSLMMIIWCPLTDGGQDGQREEGGLGVVPVDAELLAHDVHTRPGRLGDDLLVGVQGSGDQLKVTMINGQKVSDVPDLTS